MFDDVKVWDLFILALMLLSVVVVVRSLWAKFSKQKNV